MAFNRIKSVTAALVIAAFLAIGLPFIAANAQVPPGFAPPPSFISNPVPPQQVSGTYADSESGLKITLPDGWKGNATSAGYGTIVGVIPPNMASETTMMTISISNNAKLKQFQDYMKQFGKYMPNATQPTNNTASNSQCPPVSQQQVTINGMVGYKVEAECSGTTNGQQWYSHSKIYGFGTSNDTISIIFSSNSSSAYNQYVGQFDSSVNTLNIPNTVNLPAPTTTPEFPLSAVIGITAVIGIVAVFSRTKFLSSPKG